MTLHCGRVIELCFLTRSFIALLHHWSAKIAANSARIPVPWLVSGQSLPVGKKSTLANWWI